MSIPSTHSRPNKVHLILFAIPFVDHLMCMLSRTKTLLVQIKIISLPAPVWDAQVLLMSYTHRIRKKEAEASFRIKLSK